MPQDRRTPFARTPHSQETEKREPNKLYVKDINELLINHKTNPEKWTFDYIAARYNISNETAGTLK